MQMLAQPRAVFQLEVGRAAPNQRVISWHVVAHQHAGHFLRELGCGVSCLQEIANHRGYCASVRIGSHDGYLGAGPVSAPMLLSDDVPPCRYREGPPAPNPGW